MPSQIFLTKVVGLWEREREREREGERETERKREADKEREGGSENFLCTKSKFPKFLIPSLKLEKNILNP